MSQSPEAVANKFIELSNGSQHPVSNMKLQKLVYIAHGFHLAALGEPLINEAAHAWPYGPVYPTLYEKLRKYGAGNVSSLVVAADSVDGGSSSSAIINVVLDSYGELSAAQLMQKTHSVGTPWFKTWNNIGRRAEIPESWIREHFLDMLQIGNKPKPSQVATA